ncbi:MAG: hypothetical protein KatS3mg112_1836 [Thermogutta sp.]|nr:MAG: hypothetical protein KatS3mg112_1836 [Thermogutta sp.]
MPDAFAERLPCDKLFLPTLADQILPEENVDNGADETVQWTLTDHLNTVRDIAKYDSGSDMTTVVNHLIYDASGNLTSESNPTEEGACYSKGDHR